MGEPSDETVSEPTRCFDCSDTGIRECSSTMTCDECDGEQACCRKCDRRGWFMRTWKYYCNCEAGLRAKRIGKLDEVSG